MTPRARLVRRLRVTVPLYVLFGWPIAKYTDGWGAVAALAVTLGACWVIAAALVAKVADE